ncbi:Nuclear pore complex, Nup160 component [Plasmopara halstedii]|uniref:Nuclear pore complex, Nup160 component n=1 Tax=Plasmopara halstedii TaxID=4781 RepID=A0A0P1ANK4_PLAHL|nr:Nuclear pore complex, Nup160 component [Plasmopara halstedii]CEG42567.1 Nuclear pore complex, Nup160 component [Plasmopara halstedii]|eukprot:XP_024578936.1 Nuclear pore complex, Nup160 component [Plasmopara halstedii]
MQPLFQEAQFACFEDDDKELPRFVISNPSDTLQPHKSFARVHTIDCTGSGSFYFQMERLRDRFLCWRVVQNVIVFREFSLNISLKQNGIRVDLMAPIVSSGVFAVESWEDHVVSINIVTHAGTIHRLKYRVPTELDCSIFSNANVTAFPEPKVATRKYWDVIQSLKSHEIVSTALWVNEYNVVLGTDCGQVIGVNFGLPQDEEKIHEFVFTDTSVMSWIWHGILRKTTATFMPNGKRNEKQDEGAAVIAMTCIQVEDDDEKDEEKDVCVVTISTDCVLRVWSFGSQSCIGRQDLRNLVMPWIREDENDQNEWNDESLDAEDESPKSSIYLTNAKIIALPPTTSDNCRLLVHLDTTISPSSEIYLLRGDMPSTIISNAGASSYDLALQTARIFSMESPQRKRGLKMIDFAVDTNFLFSSWRSLDSEQVMIHPNPMALTGPKRIMGQVINTLDVQMQKFETEDNDWLFELKEENVVTRIDDFFTERILLPGRFSRQNVLTALKGRESNDVHIGIQSFRSETQESKYKEMLIHFVSSRLKESFGDRNPSTQNLARVQIWKDLIALCTKHWHCETVPIGFITTTNALLPGTPVMLRRNRVSFLFPSAFSITTSLLSQKEKQTTSSECVDEIVLDVLPIFDAFPSQSFQSFIHREILDVSSDWKIESFVAMARHCVRLGLMPKKSIDLKCIPEIALTQSILRLSTILGGDISFHDQVFNDLVAQLFIFDKMDETHKYHHSTMKNPLDFDEDMAGDSDDYNISEISTDSSSKAPRTLFASSQMCFAFGQMATKIIDELCHQSLRVVLFLAFIVDSRPSFLSCSTLSKLEREVLPKAVTIYQRWRLCQYVATRGMSHDESGKGLSATLLPPLLSTFLLDNNRKLAHSENFLRALSVLQLANATNNVQLEDAHGVLVAFMQEIVHYVAQPHAAMVQFLHKHHQFRLLRAIFCCALRDVTRKAQNAKAEHMHQYIRSIGECLSSEGQMAATQTLNAQHARWCFQQAIRCFRICLCHFFAERQHRPSLPNQTLDQFIYDVVGLLKETVPRGHYDQLLGFLWTLVTQALGHITHEDDAQSFAVQSFLWVNVFKYSVEEQLFRDAHLALMHLVDLSGACSGSEATVEAEETARECVNYLVKELYRYGHLDLICELQWGPLDLHVEKHILWQAANATGVKSDGLDANAVRYYNLLYSFYLRKQQPANAASSLYALALRLRLAVSTSKIALESQRNALNAACNALRVLPVANRWVVRKLHTEELAMAKRDGNYATRMMLNVVTLDDMRRELAILDGKLRLLAIGHSESLLLSTMDGNEVIALLIDAVYNSCHNVGQSTVAERRRAGVLTIEVATDIATRCSNASMCGLTQSLARYCVANDHSTMASSVARADRDLLWDLLEMVLLHVASLQQYEIAAETVLDMWQQNNRKLKLPLWLRNRLSDSTCGNPAKLLILYLKHGLLSEGLQLVESLLSDSMDQINLKFEAQTQKIGTKLPDLPWIPYNLVDSLLDSTDAVLKHETSGNVSKAAVEKLREQDHSLRQLLMRYMNSVHALQQAQEAANVARSGIALDS